MTFDIKSAFSGDGDLFVKWSENYPGVGDPTAATWQEIPGVSSQLPEPGSRDYQKVAAELLPLVGKKVFIGFQYVGASSTSSASFEIDNFLVSEDGTAFQFFVLPFTDDLNSCNDFSIPSNFIQERVPGSKQDKGWECGSYGMSDSQAIRVTSLGGVTGTVDAWLISAKAFDLSSTTTGFLNFDIKSPTAGSGELKILWSENYTGSGAPGVTWSEFTGLTLPAGGSDSYENVEVDIQTATGKTVYIAFQFVGGTNSSSIAFDIDNISISSTSTGGGGTVTPPPGGGGVVGNCPLTGAGTVIASHDFESCGEDFVTPAGFIEVFGVGSKTDRGWGCRDNGTEGSRSVRASAFGGEPGMDDAWLIMDDFDATPYTKISLAFDVQSIHPGPGDLLVWYSNDYSGSGDPSSATWSQLTDVTSQLPAIAGRVFATVTTSLCDITGSSVYIAFQYVGGMDDSSASWHIDNLELKGE